MKCVGDRGRHSGSSPQCFSFVGLQPQVVLKRNTWSADRKPCYSLVWRPTASKFGTLGEEQHSIPRDYKYQRWSVTPQPWFSMASYIKSPLRSSLMVPALRWWQKMQGSRTAVAELQRLKYNCHLSELKKCDGEKRKEDALQWPNCSALNTTDTWANFNSVRTP